MTGVLLVSLPESPANGPREAHWWHFQEDSCVASGADAGWVAVAEANGLSVIGLAPAAAVRLIFDSADRSGSTPRQAAAVARLEALETCVADADTLHAVSGAVAPDQPIVTAVVANATMLDWVDWGRAAGAEFDRIVPPAAFLPLSEHWKSAAIGNDRVLARTGFILPDEPGLADTIVAGEEVGAFEQGEERSALRAAAETSALNLRTGRFAKKRGLVVDRDRIRELILLACLIPLVTLLWALIAIFNLNRSTASLDQESVRLASSALGRPVTLENAEAELASSRGQSGLTAPLAALSQALQAETAVSSTQIGYGGGTFSATLAGPSVNEINRLLIALQRDGYRVTAVPRQAPDGRAMVDLTIRTGP